MKIDVCELRHVMITSEYKLLNKDLFYHLHMEVYGAPPFMKWQQVKPGSTLKTLKWSEVNLSHMARELRSQGWSVYHWRDRHGVDYTEDTNTFINYGKREGLIFGAYCGKLLEWKLSNL